MASVDMQFSQDDKASWTHLETLADDTCQLSIPLGFTYNGFGASVSSISVSSNGVLFFGQGCSTAFTEHLAADGHLAEPDAVLLLGRPQ